MSNAAIETAMKYDFRELTSPTVSLNANQSDVRNSSIIEFQLLSSPSKSRANAEKFIAERFQTAFGATVVEFFPFLLSRSDAGELSSLVGLRPGTQRPLFLEQYLDESLESTISRISMGRIARKSLVEIGNLASRCKSGNQLMFTVLTAVLAKAGYTWVVFTATEQIRLLLQRLRFEPITLCEANPVKLANKEHQWGDYYLSQPKVQAGNIQQALEILQLNPFTARLLDENAWEIERLADALMASRTTDGVFR